MSENAIRSYLTLSKGNGKNELYPVGERNYTSLQLRKVSSRSYRKRTRSNLSATRNYCNR
ncbi:hypothetical protein PL9214500416 [Planktothrix tepida PCC 9214]|uniref:Uncharacterized protein n=1 Tax=Planktothrix tepida PCC 9214 TaxID=671072 RepID=A0A1J1LNK5_9CYAN|nr:hypothetical protein PL9214500416 [Planktothrix tepida PCC 9214]